MPPTAAPRDPPPLLSRGSLCLFAATLLAYANIAVFFQYVAYLRTLPIDPRWTGLLIGTFSAVCLVLRPLVSPFFHAASTPRYLVAGNAEELRPGMAFSVEPGIYLEGRYGARIEDIVVCGDEGPIVLNEAPRDLLVVTG